VSNKLPSVTSDIPRDLRTFIDRVRELITSDGDNRFVTARELIAGGVVDPGNGGTVVKPGVRLIGTSPAPTNVTAAAAIQNIIISWDNPQYFGHSHAEIWGNSTDNIGTAVLIGLSPGAIYVDSVGPSVSRYYWVRFVNTLDVIGPFNSINGTLATTGAAVAYLLTTLAGSITSSQLATSLNSRINLIDGPAGTPGTIPNQLAQIQGQIDTINAYPTYDNGTTYATDSIVKYSGGLYKAKSSTTGNLPTNTTFWLKIGDYSSLADIVAAHTADIATITTNLGAEVTARETLATQMRGTYTGTDITSVTTGLIFSEKTARATADSGLASSISSVSATASSKNTIYRTTTAPATPALNDIWVDIKPSYAIPYFDEDYAVARNNQYQWNGTAWVDITLTDITDNFALIVNEQTARATADAAIASDVTTLETSVNDPTTGLVATRATLINDYSTTSTVNTAIANSRTVLRAYTDVSASRTFRQVSAPTKRGVDASTSADIPLQTGDIWIDLDDQNKLYQWSGTAWVYSPDGAITGSVTSLTATLTNDYLTQTDTESAIAQSGTFLRAYASIQSKVFRQADAPTIRGVDPQTAGNIALVNGDVWYDTNDSNKLYLWSGTAWVYSPDAVITGSVTAVDARVTTVESTKIGYCAIGGVATDDTTKAACEAAGGTWTVGLPLATAVKQVSVSDGSASASLEQRFTAQKTLNDGLQAQYTIKLDVNGNVAGYGIYSDAVGNSQFIANVNRFAVTTPETSIALRAVSTTYAVGAIARVSTEGSKTLVCKIGGTTGTGTLTVGAIGTIIVDGTVTWQVASRVPFAVQSVPTSIGGVSVPAGVYIDAAYVLNATIQNAQIAALAVDDTNIVKLGVNKLTAGSISVGEYIQSTNYVAGSQGWKISGNGFAEFGAAVIRGQLTAAQINSNGLSIRDADGNVILNAGSGAFSGNVTGTVSGTAASTVVSNASSALANANAAASDAADALSAADAAAADAADAVAGLSTKLNSNARNVLAGSGGLAVGTLNWNSSGVRTSGYGIGLTANGLVAYNSDEEATFVLNGSTGAASFAGTLTVGSTPALSSTTMTGSGAKINPSGTFALGNSTTNINYNGTQLTLNGDVVATGNIKLNAVTIPVTVTGAVDQVFTSSTSVSIKTALTSFPEDTTISAFFTALKIDAGAGDIEVILNVLNSSNTLVDTFAGASTGRLIQTMGPTNDKVTATFTGTYVIPTTGSYKVEAIITNPYGSSWKAEYCTIIVIGSKR
jgi:hypothetical protein